MYHIYCDKYRITQNPVSYNQLLKFFNKVNFPWNKVSSLPFGEHVSIENFKIVRAV